MLTQINLNGSHTDALTAEELEQTKQRAIVAAAIEAAWRKFAPEMQQETKPQQERAKTRRGHRVSNLAAFKNKLDELASKPEHLPAAPASRSLLQIRSFSSSLNSLAATSGDHAPENSATSCRPQ